MDYKKTLNLLKTDFPMKASLATREPEMHQRWNQMGLYQKTQEKDSPRGTFILHDGPPYSNGDVHIGTVVQNKVPKDFIVRYKAMRGFRSPYVPGWDNHGLPIENNVSKEFIQKKETPTKLEFRKRCREYAAHWVDVQREQFRRFGITGDWENPYLTMSSVFEATIVRVFGELAAKGSIYRGLKPIHWCPVDRTALADHEIEYEDHTSPSIYVRFPLRDDPNGVFEGTENAYTVIWTTTPWTIPANLAVAVHPDAQYVVAEADGDRYLVAESLLEEVAKRAGWETVNVLKSVSGSELDGLTFTHPLGKNLPFYDRESRLVMADYVTLDTGTGVVHTAPGHGREDFMTGQKYGLPILNPVNEAGIYTEEAGPFEGLDLKAANKTVVESLSEAGNLLNMTRIEHSYPHCWRCHNPVIFRATTQWFLSIDANGLREKALSEIGNVGWIPSETVNRITSMVGGRPDWCLSRQRTWGVALPVFYCEGCNEAIVTPETIESVARQVEASDSDIWFEKDAKELLPDGFKCPGCGSSEGFRKEEDVLDVWFDSGTTCRAVLGRRPELRYPADLYLEGNDQHRGWFNASLIIGVGTTGEAPYKQVVTHGMTVDEHGKKLSKSKGNFIHPLKMADQYGADVLRLAAGSYDYFADMRLGDEALKGVSENYRRLRNTFRFLLGNLYDFNPKEAVPYEELKEMDRWILHRLNELVRFAIQSFDKYEFHPVTTQAVNFFSVELSSFYLDVLKDRLYLAGPTSEERKSAQTVLWHLATTLTRLLAPILVHTTDEVWGYLRQLDSSLAESVHLAEFPEPVEAWWNEEVAREWKALGEVRDEVNKALETAKNNKEVGQPREAQVDLRADGNLFPVLERYRDELPAVFIVSQVDLSQGESGQPLAVSVQPAAGEKCARCWIVKPTVGSDERYAELCESCADVVGELAPAEG